MRKKAVALWVTALWFCVTGFIACTPPPPPPASPSDDSTVHMILLAGQSNAVGISPIATAVNADLNKTFDNVLFAGETERNVTSGTAGASYGLRESGTGVSNYSKDILPVKKGLGRNAAFIGPEYGMAEALNGRYEGERKALIFKSGAGGTTLRNIFSGNSNTEQWGNWYAPSLKAILPASEINGGTGKLYERLVSDFKTVFEKLTGEGHKVKIIGTVWMQGESDRDTPEVIADYPRLLNALVTDLRGDISEITGSDYSGMPFIAGEVSDTHGIARNANEAAFLAEVTKNQSFNAMLNGIETNRTIANFYVTNAHDMPQNELKGGLAASLNTENANDPWHWTADYMVTLGNRFIEKLTAV